MNIDKIALQINCEEVEVKETNLSLTVIFYMNTLSDVHKGIKSLQLARYPAVNGGKRTIVMTLQKYNINSDLLLDYYNDLAKVNCVGPRGSLQKNVDFRFSQPETIMRDKPEKKQPKLKRKLQTDDTFRKRKGVYKFIGDYSTSI